MHNWLGKSYWWKDPPSYLEATSKNSLEWSLTGIRDWIEESICTWRWTIWISHVASYKNVGSSILSRHQSSRVSFNCRKIFLIFKIKVQFNEKIYFHMNSSTVPYKIVAQAFNNIGSGPFSNPVIQTQEINTEEWQKEKRVEVKWCSIIWIV